MWLVFFQEDSYGEKDTPGRSHGMTEGLEWFVYKSAMAHKPLEGREAWKDSQQVQECQHLDFGLLAPRLQERRKFCYLLSRLCLQQP